MRRAQAGFTLVELMISLVLFSFAIAGVLAVAVSMSQGFREQRAAIGAEGAVRVPLDYITDALRQASPGAPSGNIQDAGTCSTTVLAVTNNQTSLTGGITGWDKLEVIFASGAVVTSTRAVYDTSSNSLAVNDASALVAGDYVVISNTGQGHLFKLTAVVGNTLTLASPCGGYVAPAGGLYSPGSLVIRAQHATFTIDAVDGVPTLMMDPDSSGASVPEPLAEGVEDMQIAIGVDVNGDGQIQEVGAAANDDEWQGNFAGDSALVGPVRAVRVTMIARTTSGLVGNANPYVRPAAEDHSVGVTFDKFRRRVLKSMIEIRNMGGSP